jgi:hypothetical protein
MAEFNIWRWQAKDKYGKLIEAAPGHPFFESRGPTSKAVMIREAHRLLNMRRLDAVTSGMEDPGYALIEESVTGIGHTERVELEDDMATGTWRPKLTGGASVVPIDLPTDAAVRESDNRLAAEKLGIPDNH